MIYVERKIFAVQWKFHCARYILCDNINKHNKISVKNIGRSKKL